MNPPPPVDIAIAALRWVEYAGLMGFIGVVVIRRLAAMRPAINWARPSMLPALVAACGGGVAVVAAEALRAGHASIAIALPLAGHAALANPAAGAIFTDVIHVLSAGAWAGGILVLGTLRPPAGWGGEEGRALIVRFGRVAFLAFAITALTGVLRAAGGLRGIEDLWATPYGVVLVLKTAGVLVMVAMSAVMSARGMRFARAEGVVALLVLAATAVLAAFPMPPAQA